MKNFIILLLAISLSACVKEPTDNTITTNNTVQESSNCSRLLTDSQVEFIADMHNEYLLSALHHADSLNSYTEETLEEAFVIIEASDTNLNYNVDFDNINSVEENLDSIEANVSSLAFTLIEEGMEKADSVTSYQHYVQEIEGLESEARSNLNCFNLDVVLVTLEVFKKSAYIWFPEDIGGLGYGSKFTNVNSPQFRTPSCCEWLEKMLAADAGAAGAGLTGAALAALAFAGPFGVATLAGIGIGSALSSAGTALYNKYVK